jgi:hypothetical protein
MPERKFREIPENPLSNFPALLGVKLRSENQFPVPNDGWKSNSIIRARRDHSLVTWLSEIRVHEISEEAPRQVP